jgi:hypothetical protein
VRKYFQILFFTLIANFCYGQVQNHFTFLIDQLVIESRVDSLLKDGVEEILVLQTIKPFDNLKSEDSILTFICWTLNQNYFVQIITDNCIYSTVNFRGQAIFNFKDKIKTFVTTDERVLKFTPPIVGGNSVYYFIPNSSKYFELTGSNTQPWTYVPNNKQKEKIREKWFDIIYKTLYNEHFNFRNMLNYDRYENERE